MESKYNSYCKIWSFIFATLSQFLSMNFIVNTSKNKYILKFINTYILFYFIKGIKKLNRNVLIEGLLSSYQKHIIIKKN